MKVASFNGEHKVFPGKIRYFMPAKFDKLDFFLHFIYTFDTERFNVPLLF